MKKNIKLGEEQRTLVLANMGNFKNEILSTVPGNLENVEGGEDAPFSKTFARGVIGWTKKS
jgi:hypothetical protein